MLRILTHPTFSRLFAAQAVAILGTGLLTIALGLLAFDIAGANAGQVLGIAFTIKMLAYVGLSPIMTALTSRLNRRAVLITADLIRAAAALCLPFIDATWQIYALIFVLQAASATFTPTFQAVIPEVLTDEADYTRALSLSRLAYDIENVLSPVLAGLLLSFILPNWLFLGTCAGFLISAALILSIQLPNTPTKPSQSFLDRLTRGSRIYLATPRLRGLLALNATISAVGAIVLVQSVVIAKSIYEGSDQDLALLLGAFGLGSMIVALALPKALDHLRDRPVMLTAAAVLATLMTATGLGIWITGWPSWTTLLIIWFTLGAANAALMTPSGRLLRRSAHTPDRPAIFAAQFALSHACWLLAYPLTGFLGASIGLGPTMILMGALGLAGLIAARAIWPANTPDKIEHSHADLPPDHPHLKDAEPNGSVWVHRHRIVIDDEHHAWPTNG